MAPDNSSLETKHRPTGATALSLKKPYAIAAVLAATLCIAWFVAPIIRQRLSKEQQDFDFVAVVRGSFEVTLTERGKLESQNNVKIISEAEDVRGDGVNGNAIIEIVPNGSHVKKGDLLVTLDSGIHIERVDEQMLETDIARADQTAAEVLYQNQLSQNETIKATAELNVRLAELQLAMFKHPTNGTHRLEVDKLNRLIDDTENEIMAAKAKLQLSENERRGLEELFQFGYAGKSELDKVRLDYLQAQSEVAAKTNRLETQLANVEKKNKFEQKMSLLEFEGAVVTAKRMLEQVELDNNATEAQAKTELIRANRILATEERLLARYRRHLEACKIYAPQDGMVAYSVPRSSRQGRIELGALVWEGQQILSIPDLKRMMVKTAVHETARSMVSAGLKATIRLEAFPDYAYSGTITNVDLMPDRRNWDESDTKVYKTVVTIDEEVSNLKPGMTAVVEIHVTEVEDALTIPVEAVVHDKGEKYCYLKKETAVERVAIELGHSNSEVVEVLAGLKEGDFVVANPAIIE